MINNRDYHVADFPGYEEPLWVAKAQHVSRARELSHGKIKIIELNIGMFIEFILIVSQMDHCAYASNIRYRIISHGVRGN